MNKLFTLLFVSMFLLVGSLSFGSAVSCSGTFIDMSSYNVCYSPNQSASGSLNITDNSNNTLLEYFREVSSVSGGSNYKQNLSDVKTLGSIKYIDFFGQADSKNATMRGTYYFSDSTIYIIVEKTMYHPTTTGERTQYNNYNVTSYIKGNGSVYVNSGGADAILTNWNTIKHLTNNGILNYSISSFISKAQLNLSSHRYFSDTQMNLSKVLSLNATTLFDETSSSATQVRTTNISEIIYSSTLNTNSINNEFWLIESSYLVNFDEDYFTIGGDITNGTAYSIYKGMRGYIPYIQTGCDNSFSTLKSSCSQHQISEGLLQSYIVGKYTGKNIFYTVPDLKLYYLNKMFINSSNLNRLLMPDYNFYPINGQTNNAFNHTHTRTVADISMTLSEFPNKTSIVNSTSEILINYLQNTTIYNLINPSYRTSSHSRNTQTDADNLLVLNTHTITTSSLIAAQRAGYNIDQTKLNQNIFTAYSLYSYIFNDTAGNDSYYQLISNGTYFSTNPQYGPLFYVDYEVQDYRIMYLYNKTEALRNISNRKIDELNRVWNGSSYISIHGSDKDYNMDIDIYYGYSRAEYQKLNISSFTLFQSARDYLPSITKYAYGMSKIPNGKTFVNVYYPVFLSKQNTTYFINQEDNLMFETPAYAMIPDFKYDNQGQKGMKIWIKWAYNTNGNFSNLSYIPYKYFYSPQHTAFINWSRNYSFSSTSDKTTYWVGNLSASTTFTLQENVGNKFYVDSELLGYSNDTLWFSSSSSTNKHIASNLSDTINDLTVIINVDNCESVGKITYTPNSGSNIQTFNRNDYTCSNNQVTLTLDNIEPSLNSNEIDIEYGCSSMTRIGYNLVMIFASLLLAFFVAAFSWTAYKEGKIEIGQMIMVFVTIVVCAGLWLASGQNLGASCGVVG